MMKLTGKQIGEFKRLYQEQFDIELSEDDAKKKGSELILIVQNNLRLLKQAELKPIAPTQLKLVEDYNEQDPSTANKQILSK